MTVGKDVSALFPDVVNCMQTDNLELKKLVYLYLMNYAKSQPDMAIMAVNTFVKVSPQHNAQFSEGNNTKKVYKDSWNLSKYSLTVHRSTHVSFFPFFIFFT